MIASEKETLNKAKNDSVFVWWLEHRRRKSLQKLSDDRILDYWEHYREKKQHIYDPEKQSSSTSRQPELDGKSVSISKQSISFASSSDTKRSRTESASSNAQWPTRKQSKQDHSPAVTTGHNQKRGRWGNQWRTDDTQSTEREKQQCHKFVDSGTGTDENGAISISQHRKDEIRRRLRALEENAQSASVDRDSPETAQMSNPRDEIRRRLERIKHTEGEPAKSLTESNEENATTETDRSQYLRDQLRQRMKASMT